jgi:hypothetical protein
VARMTTPELKLLLRRCHEWEAAVDPNGIGLPRAKRHDDKTLAVINFSASVGAGAERVCQRNRTPPSPQ